MSFSPSDSKLFGSLFSDEETVALFSDEALLKRLLEVESALAKVQGELGLIPAAAAQEIAVGAGKIQIDWRKLRAETQRSGYPIIELVKQLREHVGGEAASYLHWGATTQDIMDTALVLQVRSALKHLENKLANAVESLAKLVEKHRNTLMAGRTHSQQALPITFGLKVAVWLAPLLRHRQRLKELKPRVLVVQFGGAAGTLASLGDRGLEVRQTLAEELGLGVPLTPWHTQRDTFAELAGWLSLVSGSLAKMAQDVVLLAQTEVGELRESGDAERGGSSTMPQKSNPIQSELIIAAARQNAQLLASVHHALIQEHERGTHGWQLELLALPQMFALTASAVQKASWLAENLVVNETRMLKNVSASNGLMLAEAASFALAEHLPRAEAKHTVKETVADAEKQNKHLIDVLREKVDLPLRWNVLRDEATYLGATQTLIDDVLQALEEP